MFTANGSHQTFELLHHWKTSTPLITKWITNITRDVDWEPDMLSKRNGSLACHIIYFEYYLKPIWNLSFFCVRNLILNELGYTGRRKGRHNHWTYFISKYFSYNRCWQRVTGVSYCWGWKWRIKSETALTGFCWVYCLCL